MELAVHALQPAGVDLSVDLRCLDAGVAEQLLNLSQIGSAAQQVRGKAVP